MSGIFIVINVIYLLSVFFLGNSRIAGHRFGEHLEKFFPLIQKYSKEEDDELREFCLQAFEAFVQRCPREITTYIPSVSLSLQFTSAMKE